MAWSGAVAISTRKRFVAWHSRFTTERSAPCPRGCNKLRLINPTDILLGTPEGLRRQFSYKTFSNSYKLKLSVYICSNSRGYEVVEDRNQPLDRLYGRPSDSATENVLLHFPTALSPATVSTRGQLITATDMCAGSISCYTALYLYHMFLIWFIR